MPGRPFSAIVRRAPAGSGSWAEGRILLRRPAPVLFAFGECSGPSWGLQRAIGLSRALDSELHAIFVSSQYSSSGSACVEHTGGGASGGGIDDGPAVARAWLAEALGEEGEPEALCSRWGDFTEQVAAHAGTIDASMIVVPPLRSGGEGVTALVHAARVPVLVARDRTLGDAIVAATDLEDCSYPVLRVATHLSRRLAVPLIALHNLSPISVLSAMETVLSEPRRRVRTLLEIERDRLHHAVRELPGSATPVMAEEVDPVEAILREARGGGVDLVAVGARRENWWARWIRRSVTVRVVERAPCSVLVVPMPEGPATGYEALALA